MPQRESNAPFYSRFLETQLAQVLNTALATPLLNGTSLHLLHQRTLTLGPDLLLSALTGAEASFTGYAASVIQTGTGPIGGSLVRLGTTDQGFEYTALFAATGTTAQDTVTGYFISSAAQWLSAEYFPVGSEVLFAASGDWLSLTAVIGVGPFYKLPAL